MKFLYEYRTRENELRHGELHASTRDAAFAALKAQGVKPSRLQEAPGFFNKLFGKGKRWLAIGALCSMCLVLGVLSVSISHEAQSTKHQAQALMHEAQSTKHQAQALMHQAQSTEHQAQALIDIFDSKTRRQVIGDAAVIAEGIRTGWADVFTEEGDRFLASFAIPGVKAGQRNTTAEALERVLFPQAPIPKHQSPGTKHQAPIPRHPRSPSDQVDGRRHEGRGAAVRRGGRYDGALRKAPRRTAGGGDRDLRESRERAARAEEERHEARSAGRALGKTQRRTPPHGNPPRLPAGIRILLYYSARREANMCMLDTIHAKRDEIHAIALKETVAFTERETLESFLGSTLLIRGVTASFEIAGEATKNLTSDFRDAHPEIKWRDMAGFRDVLIHGYFGIEASRLWQGAKEFAPETIAAIEKLDEYRQAREEDARL